MLKRAIAGFPESLLTAPTLIGLCVLRYGAAFAALALVIVLRSLIPGGQELVWVPVFMLAYNTLLLRGLRLKRLRLVQFAGGAFDLLAVGAWLLILAMNDGRGGINLEMMEAAIPVSAVIALAHFGGIIGTVIFLAVVACYLFAYFVVAGAPEPLATVLPHIVAGVLVSAGVGWLVYSLQRERILLEHRVREIGALNRMMREQAGNSLTDEREASH